MKFVDDNHMFDQVILDRANDSLHKRVLPGVTISSFHFLNAHGLDRSGELSTINFVVVAQQELLYSSALRISELCNLRIEDLDLDGKRLRINNGKFNKDRVVPVGKVAAKFLEIYLLKVRAKLVGHSTEDYLFISKRGNQVKADVTWVAIKKYAKMAGIKKNVFPHAFRATCATHCLTGGDRGLGNRKKQMNPRYVMELLGHANLSTLHVYTAVTITDLKEAHKRCHPRNFDKVLVPSGVEGGL